MVGAIGGLVALGLFYLMVRYGQYSKLFSNLVSGILCQVINFFPQKYWTFQNLDQSEILKQMTEFIIGGTVGIILNLALLYFLNKRCKVHFIKNKIAADFICTIAMYLFSRTIF